MSSGSGLYDQGFSEGVIDQMDFDYYTEYLHPKDDKYKVNWYCVEGGTSLLPEAMAQSLKTPLTKENFKKRVTKIAYNREEGVEKLLQVKIHGETEAREYLSVFNTTTLACLQRMDLTELGLLYEQKGFTPCSNAWGVFTKVARCDSFSPLRHSIQGGDEVQ